MRAAIVTFPGSNCDYDLVILPGGFSYGDYLRAGAIARFSPIMKHVQRFAAEGGHVLGVCNGFQILCEAGMLPGALIRNRSLKFQGERVYIRVESTHTAFTAHYQPGQLLHLHIAHGEGNYVADAATIAQLEAENRVVFRYVDASGEATDAGNANGSMNNIAGIISEAGNVLGLMPHPERSVEALLGSTDGLPIFSSLAERLATAGRSA
jgi:phosphoribosylformylglycinamidine synthase I